MKLPKSNSFKVIPFHLKALVHSPFPRLKTFLEGIFWNLFELRPRSHFNVIDVRKMGFLQNRFDLREEKKVTRGQIGEICGCFKIAMFLFVRNWRILRAVWAGNYRDGASMRGLPKGSTHCFLRYSRQSSFRIPTQGQTVNHTVYKKILWRLVRSVHDKRQSLWEAHAWALHHNNTPAHTALSICQFLAERNIATLEHPPYSTYSTRWFLFFAFLRPLNEINNCHVSLLNVLKNNLPPLCIFNKWIWYYTNLS